MRAYIARHTLILQDFQAQSEGLPNLCPRLRGQPAWLGDYRAERRQAGPAACCCVCRAAAGGVLRSSYVCISVSYLIPVACVLLPIGLPAGRPVWW
jgi:hypothetical protein